MIDTRFMDVKDADIERALRTAARVIDRYGDVYWPLFERLEAELDRRRSRAARLAVYSNYAASSEERDSRLGDRRVRSD